MPGSESDNVPLKLPEEVVSVISTYEAIDHSAATLETKRAIQAVVSELQTLAEDTSRACAVQFYAHSMIAQIGSEHTDRTDTEQISEILFHLAKAVTIGLECGDVPERSIQIARSNHGMWLGQVAEQLDPAEVEQVTAESERTLRAVHDTATAGTREQVIRACNLASHLLAGGTPAGTTEALGLLEAQTLRSHLLGPESEPDYFRQLGNAYRRTANNADRDSDAATHRRTAMSFYRKVEAATPESAPTTLYAEIALLNRQTARRSKGKWNHFCESSSASRPP